MEAALKSIGFDRYERQARLKPALLTILPVLAMATVWLPAAWGPVAGLAGLVAGCGLTFMMAKVARHCGRRIEQRLEGGVGARHTTIFLRHQDRSISSATKARYHAFLSRQGIVIPTAEEETSAPDLADEAYRGAVDWLLEATRNEKGHPLLKDENIDYGFRRNLLGLKPVGLTLSIVCLITDGSLAYATYSVDDTRFWTAILLGTCLLGGVLAWIFWVNKSFVEDASRSYAKRLLAQCDLLDKPIAIRTGSPAARRPNG